MPMQSAPAEYQGRFELGYGQSVVRFCLYLINKKEHKYPIKIALCFLSRNAYYFLFHGLTQICAKYPYGDQYYGVFSAYGPQIAVCLPSNFVAHRVF